MFQYIGGPSTANDLSHSHDTTCHVSMLEDRSRRLTFSTNWHSSDGYGGAYGRALQWLEQLSAPHTRAYDDRNIKLHDFHLHDYKTTQDSDVQTEELL